MFFEFNIVAWPEITGTPKKIIHVKFQEDPSFAQEKAEFQKQVSATGINLASYFALVPKARRFAMALARGFDFVAPR